MDHEQELADFVDKLDEFSKANCPSFLAPNSYFVGIEPGHNLDLLKIAFDFRVDRTTLLRSETPNVLKDPSKPELRSIK